MKGYNKVGGEQWEFLLSMKIALNADHLMGELFMTIILTFVGCVMTGR